MKNINWLYTDLITPFKKWNWIDNVIDFKALDKLIDFQLEANVDWIVLLWANSESQSLIKKEHLEIVKFVTTKVKWKIKILVNIPCNWTIWCIKHIKKLDKIDNISWYIITVPYYIFPTQSWLYGHFTSIAKNTDRNIIISNSKIKTWIDLELNTTLKIIEESENIIGIIFDEWNIKQEREFTKKLPENFKILSWNDKSIYDFIYYGWKWLISTASNILPKIMKEYIDYCLKQDKKAKEIYKRYFNFFDKLNLQTSPLPTKTYLANKEIIKWEFRLPLCRMDLKEKEEFLKYSDKMGI